MTVKVHATSDSPSNNMTQGDEHRQGVTAKQTSDPLERVRKQATEGPTGSVWGSTSEVLVENTDDMEGDVEESWTDTERDLSSSSEGDTDDSGTNDPLKESDQENDANDDSANDDKHGRSDLPAPHSTEDAWKAKFWPLAGHRRIPTNPLTSADAVKLMQSNHDTLISGTRRVALLLAEQAQAIYTRFLRDLEGKCLHPEIDEDIDLERPFCPIARGNVSNEVARELLRATLKARKAVEIAEALSMYPSHLIENVRYMEGMLLCVEGIKDNYRKLEDQVADSDAGTAPLTNSEEKMEKIDNNHDARIVQEPIKVILWILFTYSLLWLGTVLLLPRYIGPLPAFVMITVNAATDLHDLFRRRVAFWNTEVPWILGEDLIIKVVVRSQALVFLTCQCSPLCAVDLVCLLPFLAELFGPAVSDIYGEDFRCRSIFKIVCSGNREEVQGPFPYRSVNDSQIVKLASFQVDLKNIRYLKIWLGLVKIIRYVLLYIVSYSKDSLLSKTIALAVAFFLGSELCPRPQIVDRGHETWNLVLRENSLAVTSDGVRCPSWQDFAAQVRLHLCGFGEDGKDTEEMTRLRWCWAVLSSMFLVTVLYTPSSKALVMGEFILGMGVNSVG